MMKKNIIYYSIAAIVGLFIGYLIFSDAMEHTENHQDHAEEISTDQTWACSMHPQIMKAESGSCPICGMDLTLLTTDDDLEIDRFTMTENAVALANIQTTVLGEDQIDEGVIRLSGKIMENEAVHAVQTSYFSGRIEKLYINFTGEKVRKGQLLASIYAPQLISAQQELLTAKALKTTQAELYKAVRNKLRLWKLSEDQIDQIEISGKIKAHFPIYATVSGTVIDKMVEEGDEITQGKSLYKVTDLTKVWAVFDVYENQIAAMSVGQKMKIRTKVYPERIFEAKLAFIDPVLNTNTRTVMIRAVLNNNDELFKPGMFVEADVEAAKRAKDTGIIVPASAVLWTGKRSVVYIKANPDQPIFEMREVLLGHYNGESYEVLNGLNIGEEIVTHGTFTVDAAAQLQGKKSMMHMPER